MQRPPARAVFFVIFCVVLAFLAWGALRWLESWPQRFSAAAEAALVEKAKQLRAQFFSVAHFEPRIRIRQRVLSEATTPVAELAVLEKTSEVEREFVHSWAGSTKTLRLRGKYRVKAGFNLLERFEIQVEKDRSRILLPPPTILSVEQLEMHVEALENGFWNPISAADLQTAIAALREKARAESAGLLPQAEKQFAERLRGLAGSDIEVIPALP